MANRSMTTRAWLFRCCFFWIKGIHTITVNDEGSPNTCTSGYRVVVEMIGYENSDGLLMDGSKCQPEGGCLIHIAVFLDTTTPELPHQLEKNDAYSVVLSTSDDNLAFLPVQTGAKVITREECGIFAGGTLRALVYHPEVDGTTTLVNSFKCDIPSAASTSYLMSSKWPDVYSCSPAKDMPGTKLTYRYRVFETPNLQCCSS